MCMLPVMANTLSVIAITSPLMSCYIICDSYHITIDVMLYIIVLGPPVVVVVLLY